MYLLLKADKNCINHAGDPLLRLPGLLNISEMRRYFSFNLIYRVCMSHHYVSSFPLPEGVQDHGEEDELAEEGDHEGGRGDDLRQQEEEHGEREQDGDGEADLNRYNRQSDKLISVDSRL